MSTADAAVAEKVKCRLVRDNAGWRVKDGHRGSREVPIVFPDDTTAALSVAIVLAWSATVPPLSFTVAVRVFPTAPARAIAVPVTAEKVFACTV